jgi:hypothetical protein
LKNYGKFTYFRMYSREVHVTADYVGYKNLITVKEFCTGQKQLFRYTHIIIIRKAPTSKTTLVGRVKHEPIPAPSSSLLLNLGSWS